MPAKHSPCLTSECPRNREHCQALQEELSGDHRVEEQSPGAQIRVLLALRNRSRTRRVEPALETGQRPVQLPHPDEEAGQVLRRESTVPGLSGRANRLPRLAEPRQDRPCDLRTTSNAPETGQEQDQLTLPHPLLHSPTRHPQRHPDQSLMSTHTSRAY